MSGWHRENPELAGTEADPWMRHDGYRKAMQDVQGYCVECGGILDADSEGGGYPRRPGYHAECKSYLEADE